MTLEDLPEVHAVEVQSVPTPWPISAYRRELNNPAGNHYVVCRWRSPDGKPAERPEQRQSQRGFLPFLHRQPEGPPPAAPIVGLAGMWGHLDAAHLTISA